MWAMTYILRGMVRRQYVYLWHDFIQAIKRNFKQALVMGAIDLAVMALLAYDLLVYRANDANFLYNLFFLRDSVVYVPVLYDAVLYLPHHDHL